jgi:formylglycine-generating enzyme required for sulfatase activity
VLSIGAYIDGRSQLVIQGGAVRWHHLDFAAPGRHPDLREGEPTYLNGVAWCPAWPDSPDAQNRDCVCDSSLYAGIAPLAAQGQMVALNIDRARDRATIVQQPQAENGYTLIVEFDDNESPAADWYEVDLGYIAGGQAVSVPMADGQCPTRTPVVAALVTPLPTPVPLPGMPQPGATLTRPMNKDEMVMHYIPAGPFYMGSPEGVGEGSEHPQHVVTLGAFWIDETEVTPWHYQNCIGADVCDPPDDYALRGKPVEVTWDAAQTYCHWVGGRLPTEAEWEKAARGTDARIYPWGQEQPDCSRANHANLEGPCSDEAVDAGTHPAGASPYGVLDMAGNVAEWVSDWYDPGYYAVSPEQDPQGPDSGPERVVRGGAWDDTSSAIRAACRGARAPDERGIGFRCVVPAAAYSVVESDRYEGWYRYTNLDYGFSFHYPPDWTLEERLHTLIFRHKVLDTLYFSVVYQRVGEDRWVWRTGMPAGDFVPRGSVPFLGREISRDVLVYEGKAKVVLYNYSSALPWDEMIFDFFLDDYSGDYDRVDLPEDVQKQIDQVVSSFELDNN